MKSKKAINRLCVKTHRVCFVISSINFIECDGVISMNACELTALVTAAGNTIAAGLCDEELSLLAAVFTQLGDVLATIAATRSF